jgi:hypothetical protein
LSDRTPVELKGMKGFDAVQAAAQPLNKKWFGPNGPMGPPGPNEVGDPYCAYDPNNNTIYCDTSSSGSGGFYPYIPYPNTPVTPVEPSGGGGSGGGGSGGGG